MRRVTDVFQEIIDRIGLVFRKDRQTYSTLYEILGFYPRNIAPYKVALVHKSSSMRGEKGRKVNNERLEFLGDAILDAIVGDIVFRQFEGKREGFLTNARSKIVKRETLNKVALELKLDRLIKSSTRSVSHNNYMYGNAFEALVGAIYLDRGYDYCMKFMSERILGKIINLDKMAYKEVNFKSKLIEWGQKNRISIAFRLSDQTIDDISSPVFESEAVIEDLVAGVGKGYSKKESEQLAAKRALERLRKEKEFLDEVFAKKSERTAMEEEPVELVPEVDAVNSDISIFVEPTENPAPAPKKRHRNSRPKRSTVSNDTALENEIFGDAEMSLDSVSMRPRTREDIIAEAERAAFER